MKLKMDASQRWGKLNKIVTELKWRFSINLRTSLAAVGSVHCHSMLKDSSKCFRPFKSPSYVIPFCWVKSIFLYLVFCNVQMRQLVFVANIWLGDQTKNLEHDYVRG